MSIATGDFNGDGKLDLVTANQVSNTVSVFIGNGTGGCARLRRTPPAARIPTSVAVGDFNGDGKLDIVVANYDSNTVSVLLGNGSGGFATAVTYATGGTGPDARGGGRL